MQNILVAKYSAVLSHQSRWAVSKRAAELAVAPRHPPAQPVRMISETAKEMEHFGAGTNRQCATNNTKVSEAVPNFAERCFERLASRH
jgi:hypothetical protein